MASSEKTPVARTTKFTFVEKHRDGSDTGLTSFSLEYLARDVEHAYQIAYGADGINVESQT